MSETHTWRTPSAHSIDLDPNVAAQLTVACEGFLAELQDMAGNLNRLTALDCFGTLQSGKDMAGKFAQKATGGADSLEKSLLSHALVITEMRAPGSRRVGVHHCPADLHGRCYLYSTIQDWYQQHCYLG